MIENIKRGYIITFNYFKNFLKVYLNLPNIVILLLSVAAISIILYFLTDYIKKKDKRRRLRIIRKEEKFIIIDEIINIIEKNRISKKMLNFIACKIALYNKNSMHKNKRKAVILILVFLAISCLAFYMLVWTMSLLWYTAVIYFVITIIFCITVFSLFVINSKIRFLKELPETYKILNNRLTQTENILEAIESSMNDFSKPMRREMFRISNVLKKNSKEKAIQLFNTLENMYNMNEFTILLELIKQTHYKVYNESVKKQFEETTEDILQEYENKKDLNFIVKMYMVLSVIYPLGIKYIENFNSNALGEKAIIYYTTPNAVLFKAMIILFAFIYILFLNHIARSV